MDQQTGAAFFRERINRCRDLQAKASSPEIRKAHRYFERIYSLRLEQYPTDEELDDRLRTN